jgi:hypothetical protein
MVVSAGRGCSVWKEIQRVSLGRDRKHERHPIPSTHERDRASLFGRNKYVQAHGRETTFPDQYAKHCS